MANAAADSWVVIVMALAAEILPQTAGCARRRRRELMMIFHQHRCLRCLLYPHKKTPGRSIDADGPGKRTNCDDGYIWAWGPTQA
jgi:hypothetical protein